MRDFGQEEVPLPREPIRRLTLPFERFVHVEAASGIVLLAATLIALVLANSPFSASFLAFWKTEVGFRIGSIEMVHSLKHWINDGLMAIFFFIIGIEVKRELVVGELKEPRRAALPVFAALGGMLVPAAIYLSLQFGMPGERGWGIPMATDIAFVVGCMAVLGSRVPHGFRVMLLSLAIVDDIGAILVIAIGYTESIDLTALFVALAGVVVIFGMSKVGVRNMLVYFLVGFFVWLGFHESGVHATLAGVVLGLLTPTGAYVSPGIFGELLQRISEILHGGAWDNQAERGAKVLRFRWAVRETVPPAEYLEALLHPWVSFLIIPLFALANAGVPLELQYLRDSVAWAVAAGLLVGKPLGILLFSWLAIRLRLASLPAGVDWGTVLGGGFLAGIGFTMALFIAGLALPSELLDAAKVGILGASAVAALIGLFLLSRLLPAGGEKVRG